MSNKSTNPKGTKDYGPSELLSVRFIINKIRNVFISFCYSEIETPSIEKRATLYEKYGDEGDKFIFNIINSGEKVKKADIKSLSAGKLNQFVSSISEKGLRFDLTVPLARFVAQHFNEINFPFNRITKFTLYEINRWDLETTNNKIIKLPSKNYLKSLKSYLELTKKLEFKKYKVFDYRINNQLILK